MAAKQSTIGILDAAVTFQETTELERPEVDIPDSVVDLFQAYVVAGTDGGNIDPVVFPTDAAVGADVTNFEALRIFQRRYFVGSCRSDGCSSQPEFPGPVLVVRRPPPRSFEKWSIPTQGSH